MNELTYHCCVVSVIVFVNYFRCLSSSHRALADKFRRQKHIINSVRLQNNTGVWPLGGATASRYIWNESDLVDIPQNSSRYKA